MSRKTYLGTLAALLAALWVPLAFHPFDRSDWWLENALLFGAVALLVSTHRAFPLSAGTLDADAKKAGESARSAESVTTSL